MYVMRININYVVIERGREWSNSLRVCWWISGVK